jgi:NTP pyrophosphatase (non-canonical NTP hydrolase)
MNEKYIPTTSLGKLSWLAEECNEVAQAINKTIRVYAEIDLYNDFQYALDCVNPELPAKKQESNRHWILRELRDLKEAIKLAEKLLL